MHVASMACKVKHSSNASVLDADPAPSMSADFLPMSEACRLDWFVDVLAPPAHLPTPRGAPLPLVPVDDDPDLRLLGAVRALTGAGTGEPMVDELSEDDVRAALKDAQTMRDRFIEEHRLCVQRHDSVAAVQRAMSALASHAWPPAETATTTTERPPKRRRVGASSHAVPTRQEVPPPVEPPSPPPPRATKLGRKRTLTAGQRKANHILSEQRRRARIREACDRLCEVVPALHAPASEEVVIQNTIEHVQSLLDRQNALLEQLDRARKGHVPAGGTLALWERKWEGGADAEDGDEAEGSEDEGSM